MHHNQIVADPVIQNRQCKVIKVPQIRGTGGLLPDTDNNSHLAEQPRQRDPAKVLYPQLLAIKVRTIGEVLLRGNNMVQAVEESKAEVHRLQCRESGMSMMLIKNYVG